MRDMKRRNLKEYITGFHELCKSTGRYQLDNQNKAIVDMKSDETPVTDVDIHSSELIVNFIKRKFPQDVIISEEEEAPLFCAELYSCCATAPPTF